MSRWNGKSLSSGQLAKIYSFTDLDGSQPDAWRYMTEVQDGQTRRRNRLSLTPAADRSRSLSHSIRHTRGEEWRQLFGVVAGSVFVGFGFPGG